LLSFAKIVDLIQYLLGGTVFSYSTALGTYKRTSRVCHLEALGRALTGSIVYSMTHCLLLPSNAHANPTLGIYNTYSISVTCRTAYTALTLRAVPFGFGTV